MPRLLKTPKIVDFDALRELDDHTDLNDSDMVLWGHETNIARGRISRKVRGNVAKLYFAKPTLASLNDDSVNEIAWDTTQGTLGAHTLTTDVTFIAPTNVDVGTKYVLVLTQDGTGGHSVTFNSKWKFDGNLQPEIADDAAEVTVIEFVGSVSNTMYATAIYRDGARVQTLTDGANIDWNLLNGDFALVTIAGNRTMNAPTNVRNGKIYHLRVTQDPTGSRTLTWNSVFKFNNGTAPTLSSGANEVTVYYFVGYNNNLYGTRIYKETT